MTSDAERQRVSREKKRFAKQDEGWPWLGLVGEEREQAVRDHFGYAVSETSTEAERQARASRITGSDDAGDVLSQAQAIWGRQTKQTEAVRREKYEGLRDQLVEKGVQNVPVSFELDAEARAERARRYAEWRAKELAENG